MSPRQNTLVVVVALAAGFAALATFLVVHRGELAALVLVLGLGVSALLARGWRVVVDQSGGSVGGRRRTHRELDSLYLHRNAAQLRGALRVLGRWQGDGPPPSPKDAAALGTASLPDDDQFDLEQEAWSMVALGHADGAAGPRYHVDIEGSAAVRVGRRPPRDAGRHRYVVPTELRRPPHGRAYFELVPERAQRVRADRD
jgi:hypothetical protein